MHANTQTLKKSSERSRSAQQSRQKTVVPSRSRSFELRSHSPTHVQRQQSYHRPQECVGGPNIYSTILGPTVDEQILAGLQALFNMCGECRQEEIEEHPLEDLPPEEPVITKTSEKELVYSEPSYRSEEELFHAKSLEPVQSTIKDEMIVKEDIPHDVKAAPEPSIEASPVDTGSSPSGPTEKSTLNSTTSSIVTVLSNGTQTEEELKSELLSEESQTSSEHSCQCKPSTHDCECGTQRICYPPDKLCGPPETSQLSLNQCDNQASDDEVEISSSKPSDPEYDRKASSSKPSESEPSHHGSHHPPSNHRELSHHGSQHESLHHGSSHHGSHHVASHHGSSHHDPSHTSSSHHKSSYHESHQEPSYQRSHDGSPHHGSSHHEPSHNGSLHHKSSYHESHHGSPKHGSLHHGSHHEPSHHGSSHSSHHDPLKHERSHQSTLKPSSEHHVEKSHSPHHHKLKDGIGMCPCCECRNCKALPLASSSSSSGSSKRVTLSIDKHHGSGHELNASEFKESGPGTENNKHESTCNCSRCEKCRSMIAKSDISTSTADTQKSSKSSSEIDTRECSTSYTCISSEKNNIGKDITRCPMEAASTSTSSLSLRKPESAVKQIDCCGKCQKRKPTPKKVALCKCDTSDNLGQSESGDGSRSEVRYAITKITKFPSYTTYEVMKSTGKKPKVMPTRVEGVFVLKNKSFV